MDAERWPHLRRDYSSPACAPIHDSFSSVCAVSRLKGRGFILVSSLDKQTSSTAILPFAIRMQWRILLLFALAIVCCFVIEPGEANRQPIFVKHQTTTPRYNRKQVAMAPSRSCPTGHLLDKNGICRMIWYIIHLIFLVYALCVKIKHCLGLGEYNKKRTINQPSAAMLDCLKKKCTHALMHNERPRLSPI